MSAEVIAAEGIVVDSCRGRFTVDATIGERTMRILCTLAGRLEQRRIRVLVGDRVDLAISPYDPTRGRIVFRHRERAA